MSAAPPEPETASTAPLATSEASAKDKPAISAAQRLAESRERIRLRMLRGDRRHEARRRNAEAEAQGQEPSIADRLRAMPVIGVIADAVSAWWTHHPMRSAAEMAHGAVRETIAPLARRHPLTIVAAAFAAGTLLVWLRPWRIVKAGLVAGLLSQIAARVIAHVPIESLIASFAAFAQSRSHDPDDDMPREDAEEAAGVSPDLSGATTNPAETARQAVPS